MKKAKPVNPLAKSNKPPVKPAKPLEKPVNPLVKSNNPPVKPNKPLNDMPLLRQTMRLEITGFNQARIINALRAKEVTLKNIQRISPKILHLNISKKDDKKVFAILQKMCYNYAVIGESGFNALLRGALARIGLIAGLALFLSLAVISSFFVWRIDIDGNKAIDSAVIRRSLKELGVTKGAFIRQINTQRAAALLRDMDGIAESTVEIRGTTVYVKVYEQKDYIPPANQSAPNDIISSYDAEITRLETEKGTPVVKIGDKVPAGSTLIKGQIYNTNGEVMEECAARGRVYGRVAFAKTHIFSTKEQYYQRTGRVKKFTSISLFGLKIGGKKQPDWQKTITKSTMFLLPIKITRTVCYETQLIEKELDIDAHVLKLKNEALLNNVIRLGGADAKVTTTVTTLSDGLIMLNIYIQAEMLLGEA